jgi:hypothetical protein
VEEEKFEFANNEEDLNAEQSASYTIAASSEKIEEENFPLRNKVNKQHQSTRVLMVQTPDHLEIIKTSLRTRCLYKILSIDREVRIE